MTLSKEDFLISPETPSERILGPGLQFVNFRTGQLIKSGDTITLYTPDPESFPLPSEDLINLQWHLNRVAALSAAAIDDYLSRFGGEDYDSDGDDDYGCLPASSQATMDIFSSQTPESS
jgi:hypothetical protein